MKILDYIRPLFSHNEYRSEYIRDREVKSEAVERDRVRHDNKQKPKVVPLCPFSHTKHCNNWRLELNEMCEDYQKCIVFQELRKQRQIKCRHLIDNPAEIGYFNHGLCVRDCRGPYLCVDDLSLCARKKLRFLLSYLLW